MHALTHNNAHKGIFVLLDQLNQHHVQLVHILKTQGHRSASIASRVGMHQQQAVTYVCHVKQESLQMEQSNHLARFVTQVNPRYQDQPYVRFARLVNLVIILVSAFHAPQIHTVIQKAKSSCVKAAHLDKKVTKILFHALQNCMA